MKAVIGIAYNYFVVPANVAVCFLTEAKQVRREYDEKTNSYYFVEIGTKEACEVDVKAIDPSQIGKRPGEIE